MADKLLEGNLEERLRTYRAAGVSWQEIARRLYSEASVEASVTTLIKWGQLLGIPEPEAVSS